MMRLAVALALKAGKLRDSGKVVGLFRNRCAGLEFRFEQDDTAVPDELSVSGVASKCVAGIDLAAKGVAFTKDVPELSAGRIAQLCSYRLLEITMSWLKQSGLEQ